MNRFRDKAWAICGVVLMVLVASSVAMAADENRVSAEQGEYEAYLKEEMNFEGYQARVNEEFATYKQILREEYNAYRNEILKVWDSAEVSHKKIYVGYSKDFKVKKVVDFDGARVRISAVLPETATDVEAILKGHLLDLLNENTQSAFAGNTFATQVEAKLKKSLSPKRIETAFVAPKPLVGDIFTGKAAPTPKETKEAVKAVMEEALVKSSKAPKTPKSKVVSLEVALPKGAGVKAKAYLSEIKVHAGKRNLSPSLVLAVMETESAFNPMATSYVPAYGLMQIVPKSAGRDASKLVLGKDVVLSPSYLYNGGNNIAMGTAYLYILNDRYLASIENPTSRLYCVIAAYNTGAGNVARAFTGTTSVKKAAKKINAMPPEKVYRFLIRKLPHQETRDYLQRVTTRMKKYEKA